MHGLCSHAAQARKLVRLWDDYAFCLNADGHVGGYGTPEMTTQNMPFQPALDQVLKMFDMSTLFRSLLAHLAAFKVCHESHRKH